MNKQYAATIKNIYTGKSRVVIIEDSDPMSAHKTIYMKHAKNDENIHIIRDDRDNLVFENKTGFAAD